MPLPLVAGALLTAGRWALMKAAPVIIRGAGKLLASKVTIAGTTAYAVAPTVIPAIDNALDNKLSDAVADTPFSLVLQKLMELREFSKDQQAKWVSHQITRELEDRDFINENDENYETSIAMIDIMSRLAVNDEYGAAKALAELKENRELDINPSDIIAAYNTAQSENPDATTGELGAATFNILKEHISRQEQNIDEQTAQNRGAVDPAQNHASNNDSAENRHQGTSYDSIIAQAENLGGAALSSQFNTVVEQQHLNMFSSTNMFMATVLDWINLDALANHFKKAVIIESITSEFARAARPADADQIQSTNTPTHTRQPGVPVL